MEMEQEKDKYYVRGGLSKMKVGEGDGKRKGKTSKGGGEQTCMAIAMTEV